MLGLCQALQGIFPTTDTSLCQEPDSRLWTLRHGRFHKLPMITRKVRDGAKPGSDLHLLRPLSLCLSPKSWLQLSVHRTFSWPFSAQGRVSKNRLAETLSCRSRKHQAAEARSGWRKSKTWRHQSFRATLSETRSRTVNNGRLWPCEGCGGQVVSERTGLVLGRVAERHGSALSFH